MGYVINDIDKKEKLIRSLKNDGFDENLINGVFEFLERIDTPTLIILYNIIMRRDLRYMFRRIMGWYKWKRKF